MTDAVRVAQHGNAGVVLNESHQLIAAPRNDQIHQTVQPQQRQAFLTGGQRRQRIGDTALRSSPSLRASITASLVQRASRILSASRHYGTDAEGLHHRIRTGLKDHTHHSRGTVMRSSTRP